MNVDLTAALKNAMERGSTLDRAVQSLINAGYSSTSVNEAASSLSSSISIVDHPISKSIKKKDNQPIFQQQPQEPTNSVSEQDNETNHYQSEQPQKPRDTLRTSRNIKLSIVVVITLLILVAIIFGLIYFKEQILSGASRLSF